MMTVPDVIHCAVLYNVTFYIDATTRKEIEALVRRSATNGNRRDAITIETLDGAEVFVIADSVGVIWSTTAESREREDAIVKTLKTREDFE